MIELKAGPELDRTVAVAIGDPRMPTAIIPQYSTDLNAAFAAAEKINGWFALNKCETPSRWECKLVVDDSPPKWIEGDTPALAICAAILSAKGYDFTHGDLNAMGALNPT